MDEKESVMEEARERNPKEKANIVSIISFFFTLSMFRKGLKKELEEEDVYEVLKHLRSKPLGDKLEKEWEKQKKIKGKASILPVILKCFGVNYICYGFLQLFFKTVLVLISPRAMGKLVSYFTPGQTKLTLEDAIFYASVTVGMHCLFFTYIHSYMLLITELTMKVRISVCSLLYRKMLKMNSVSFSEISSGKIITLITKDVHAFDTAIIFANDLWIAVIQTILVGYIIYFQIGISAILGIGFFIFIVIIQVYFIGKKSGEFRYKTSHKTDERLRATQESLSAIKIIKMYAWENFFRKTVDTARKAEIKTIRNIFYLKVMSLSLGTVTSKISFYICVVTYVYFGHNITAEKAFTVLGCYNTLRSALTIFIPFGITQLAELRAAVVRIGHMLKIAEINEEKQVPNASDEAGIIIEPKILLNKAVVSIKEKKILEGINADIGLGLTVITGHVGSGKTSFLKLILEDLPLSEGFVNCKGVVSYASQEPWLYPSTIKDNILFGQPLLENRYQNVLEVCALTYDLENLANGDRTIVGDRGLNLSKGQQARINLARAIYKQADIYLLDDCLSSVDTHVSKKIFQECIQGFLKDKVCVFVSHNVQHIKKADKVIVLKDGNIENCGSYSELAEKGVNINPHMQKEDNSEEYKVAKVVNENEDCDEKTTLLVNDKTPDSGVYRETKRSGGIDINTYKRYFNYGGGLKVVVVIFLFCMASQGTLSFSDIQVSQWVDLEQNITDFKISNKTNTSEYEGVISKHSSTLNWYSILITATTVFTVVRAFIFFIFCSRASINLHMKMFQSVLNAPLRFFDTHFVGNILNKFSKDISTIDEYIPSIAYEFVRIICILLWTLYVISSVNAYFIIPSTVISVALYIVRRYFLPTSRSLKRLEGATRSPVIGHLNSSLEGLTTIRAFQAQNFVRDEFDRHQDLYTSASYMYMIALRAFGFGLDLLCIIYITVIVTAFLSIKHNIFAGQVGLAITQAFSLTGLLQWGIRQWVELENLMTCVERVLEYTNNKPEDVEGEKPNNWPAEGKIEYRDVCLMYDKTQVLNNINFEVKSKEKIGIIGRTGAGKSSIISSLFRLYPTDGQILVDGKNISEIDLQMSRTKLSIIPQDPILFSGTLRDNLDPNSEYKDSDIWNALDDVKLKTIIPNLQFKISEGGSNFSVGQKQLLCLARAIVRKNRIIVLDEATANIDPFTDEFIHKVIKEKFGDCTVLTIAHRLHFVMECDRVMVVDAGSIVEFDKPEVLLEKKGHFYNIVRQAGLLK